MLKLTLDTNCIINLLDYKSESATSVDEIAEILRYGLDGDINIAITTRVARDFDKDKDKERKEELLKRVSMFPVIGTVARTDVSTFDSGDVLAGENHQQLEQELTDIIFPGLKKEDVHYSNKINDIDHLIGHKINKRDIFVTDDQQIIKKAETLKSTLGIEIMDPKKALEYLNLQGNKSVLAQEFYDKFLVYKELVIGIISGRINVEESRVQYEGLRQWLTRKYPVIMDGLLQFKFDMVSVPVSSQRVFGQDDLLSLQIFKEKISAMLRQRNPLSIPGALSTHRYGSGYMAPSQETEIALNFLNGIEDSLLGYLGKLEER